MEQKYNIDQKPKPIPSDLHNMSNQNIVTNKPPTTTTRPNHNHKSSKIRLKSPKSLKKSHVQSLSYLLSTVFVFIFIFSNNLIKPINSSITSSSKSSNYRLPIEVNLNSQNHYSEFDSEISAFRRQKRSDLAGDEDEDKSASSSQDNDNDDNNESSFSPSSENPVSTDGSVQSKIISTKINDQNIHFYRSIFDVSQSHTHAYINWVGSGSPVIFVLSVKKRTLQNKEIVDESHLYRSEDYGKTWRQVIADGDNGFPKDSRIFKYMPSPHDDKTLVFIDGDDNTGIYKFITTQNAGKSFTTNEVPHLLDDIKFHPTEPLWLLAYSKASKDSQKQLLVSTNLGSTWTQITDTTMHKVSDKKWYWGIKDVDDPKTIHFEVQIGDPMRGRPKFYPYSCYIDSCFKNDGEVHPQQKNNLGIWRVFRAHKFLLQLKFFTV